MTCVKFETAEALKKEGFPQPPMYPGQFWYKKHETHASLIFIYDTILRGSDLIIYVCLFNAKTGITTQWNENETKKMNLVFAPTVENILPLLKTEMWYMEPDKMFVTKCWKEKEGKTSSFIRGDEEASEVAAETYLYEPSLRK